ncbi:hypothetical protein [Streptomyces bluensis]|uniref:Uncharacterized protein n=1 Tax=Streptomyces bluensis TaxID=33897 RepID=A0ABW6UDF0_9ACTN
MPERKRNVQSSQTALPKHCRCVAAVIARFPFNAESDEESCEEVAQELRDLVSSIDEAAPAHNGFWETFCDEVAIGDYADWDA